MTATTRPNGRPDQSPRRGFLARLLGGESVSTDALYAAIVAEGRKPGWYRDCGVPDTIDGRFDMIAIVFSLVALRLEREPDDGPTIAVRLTERFIDDMDGQMRELGFGDLVVGKQVGGIMGALGGRMGALRDGITEEALTRNLWRQSPPDTATVARTRTAIEHVRDRIDIASRDALMAGRW